MSAGCLGVGMGPSCPGQTLPRGPLGRGMSQGQGQPVGTWGESNSNWVCGGHLRSPPFCWRPWEDKSWSKGEREVFQKGSTAWEKAQRLGC